MTPEETFTEIARLLNKILEAEGYYDFGVETDGVYPVYLLGKMNDTATGMNVVAHLTYNEEHDLYEMAEGDPRDA